MTNKNRVFVCIPECRPSSGNVPKIVQTRGMTDRKHSFCLSFPSAAHLRAMSQRCSYLSAPAVDIAGFCLYLKIAHSPDFDTKKRIKNQRSQESL